LVSTAEQTRLSQIWAQLPKTSQEKIQTNLVHLSDDALIKMARQLEFWIEEDLQELEMNQLVYRLVDAATWRRQDNPFQVPTIRFGRTELSMPILTCGSMRFQHTWIPDTLPISNTTYSVSSPSQANVMEIVRQCLSVGIYHFETARLYGTSEVQLCAALKNLLDSGEIQRSDFILQTKLPLSADTEAFCKHFERSWSIFSCLGHIDLLSFWVVSSNDQTKWALAEGDDTLYATALQWKAEGKIRHIGFSTHGTADNILQLIESNRFDYVNLHYHYFGSYHASGTMDGHGGQGNARAIQRAKDLDMGIFLISPVDKGGKLFEPSAVVARTIGPRLNPIAFALLRGWKEGMHTASVGFARQADLDEAMEAARLYGKYAEVEAAVQRLDALKQQRLGPTWTKSSLLNLPNCYHPGTQLTLMGHILWLYNEIKAYGMYSFAKDRYKGMLGCKWDDKKTFEENAKAM